MLNNLFFPLSDESSYSPEDPYASYYSSEEQPAEHRQTEDEGFLGFVGRTFSDMSTFFWSKVDEGMATIKGFVEQPSAVARQAISPFTSLLPSINEVRIYFLKIL